MAGQTLCFMASRPPPAGLAAPNPVPLSFPKGAFCRPPQAPSCADPRSPVKVCNVAFFSPKFFPSPASFRAAYSTFTDRCCGVPCPSFSVPLLKCRRSYSQNCPSLSMSTPLSASERVLGEPSRMREPCLPSRPCQARKKPCPHF